MELVVAAHIGHHEVAETINNGFEHVRRNDAATQQFHIPPDLVVKPQPLEIGKA
jgi:hypothetical protein